MDLGLLQSKNNQEKKPNISTKFSERLLLLVYNVGTPLLKI